MPATDRSGKASQERAMPATKQAKEYPRLDLSDLIRSTPPIRFSVTHVMCQHVEPIEVKKHIKYMARQRCVGANGNSTD